MPCPSQPLAGASPSSRPSNGTLLLSERETGFTLERERFHPPRERERLHPQRESEASPSSRPSSRERMKGTEREKERDRKPPRTIHAHRTPPLPIHRRTESRHFLAHTQKAATSHPPAFEQHHPPPLFHWRFHGHPLAYPTGAPLFYRRSSFSSGTPSCYRRPLGVWT